MQQPPRFHRNVLRSRVPQADPDRARAPEPVTPSSWMLPDPPEADEDGVLGVGADLQPSTLIDAYRRGIFPWPHGEGPLPWFSPDPRGLLSLERFKVSRSLRRTLRTSGWTTTVDRAFPEVVEACGSTRADEGTWITTDMARAYHRLHRLGWAHSLEVWDGEDLVGGVYGVQAGGIFTGESMFHTQTDASKVALLDLLHRLHEADGVLLDVQLTTSHLRSLGAIDVPREEFVDLLRRVRDRDVRLMTTQLAVDRLLPSPPAEERGA